MKSNRELETLTQAYLDGSISGEDSARLNFLLGENEKTRRIFAEALNLDSALAAAATELQLENDPISLLATPENVISLPDQANSRKRPDTRGPVIVAIAACLALLVAGALKWWPSQPAGDEFFATVEKQIGIDYLSAGTILGSQTQTIAKGTLELVTALGVQLVIEAPAEFRFENSQRLHLLRGRLAADVPPRAKGFTIITPTGEAVDLGTRFGVDVAQQGALGSSEIHVFEGEVVAHPEGNANKQSLRAGDALAMESGSSATRDFRSSAFIQPEEMRALSAGISDRQRERSETAFAKLREDPALIAALDFESDLQFGGVFRMVQGRWPGSRAPEFINGGDHLRLDVGGDQLWPQLSLCAWVRLDQLGAKYQSLLHADGWENDPGLVHWMVNESATMRFAMWANTLPPDPQRTHFYPDSQTPVTTSQGRWVHLAVVYDSVKKSVRFYHNGRFDNKVHHADAHPARLGPVQLGNWDQQERKLSGRVDEFAILGRAMTDEEVAALYQAGNPYP